MFILTFTDGFVCKNVGRVKNKVDIRTEKNVRHAIANCTRSLQRDDSSALLYEELGKINSLNFSI